MVHLKRNMRPQNPEHAGKPHLEYLKGEFCEMWRLYDMLPPLMQMAMETSVVFSKHTGRQANVVRMPANVLCVEYSDHNTGMLLGYNFIPFVQIV